jgi:hypothetical protein
MKNKKLHILSTVRAMLGDMPLYIIFMFFILLYKTLIISIIIDVSKKNNKILNFVNDEPRPAPKAVGLITAGVRGCGIIDAGFDCK